MLVRQWAGRAPSGFLVPEGLEDCVVELPDYHIWLQIKSRKDGSFSQRETQSILDTVKTKAKSLNSKTSIKAALALEQSCVGIYSGTISDLFGMDAPKVIVCKQPETEILRLLTETIPTSEIIAEGIASDLYKLVSDAAAENASLPLEKRRRISPTEVERRIFERLEAEDPSAIDKALVAGFVSPVDFFTPITEPSFYLGVKSRPGHIASGLILARPDETKEIASILKEKRHVLVSAPSGAGKSALMWLVAHDLSLDCRWFQVSSSATAADANSIIQFIRARRPGRLSPVALAVDDVSFANSDLWDVLVRELRALPDVLLLGSIRREDEALISNKSDTHFVGISLNEKLAESIWKKLADDKYTEWSHWREPFEQSEGLLLEYVHILTQGERLSAVISEQVVAREKEERTDELAIIRVTAALCSRGGEVDAKKLLKALEIQPEKGSLALKRLIDEHLVRENQPGILGGLHSLRSDALNRTAHDEIIFHQTESVWKGLLATTPDTLPRIIRSILAETAKEGDENILQKFSNILAASSDVQLWAALLTGLGLATLEREVGYYIHVLEKNDVQKAHWSLAAMFYDVDTTVPEIPERENWQKLRNAVYEFRELPKRDLRGLCIGLLPEKTQMPSCQNLAQANALLSCVVPFGGNEPLKINFDIDFSGIGEQDIHEISALLETAYLMEPKIAERLVTALGGEEALFSWFHTQTPWVSLPVIESDAEHGRTARSDFYLIAEQHQSDPHDTVCKICETLISLSPQSDAAASSAVGPNGQVITIGDFQPWVKNMPRRNIHAKARVAWNVAFRQIFLARASIDSLTNYTQDMCALVQRTEKVFRSFTEKWITGKSIANADKIAEEINDITQKVNDLSYAPLEIPSSSMATPAQAAGADDTLGALITGILGNLVPQLSKIGPEDNVKSTAVFSGDLSDQALNQADSDIWRTILSPPSDTLRALSKRLSDISAILHEMAFDNSTSSLASIVTVAKKGGINRAITTAARRCRNISNTRLQKILTALTSEIKERGWNVECHTRPISKGDSVYWPSFKIAILVNISDFETDVGYIEDCLVVGEKHLKKDWLFSIAPLLKGKIIASLAMQPSTSMPLPDLDFEQDWKNHITQPFLAPQISNAFDAAISACIEMSAILNCRNINSLHPVEDRILSGAIDAFKDNRAVLELAGEVNEHDAFLWALDYLDQTWNSLAEEFEVLKDGSKPDAPLCFNPQSAMSGQENQWAIEIAAARMLLRQAECMA